jgi:hypothetical protein
MESIVLLLSEYDFLLEALLVLYSIGIFNTIIWSKWFDCLDEFFYPRITRFLSLIQIAHMGGLHCRAVRKYGYHNNKPFHRRYVLRSPNILFWCAQTTFSKLTHTRVYTGTQMTSNIPREVGSGLGIQYRSDALSFTIWTTDFIELPQFDKTTRQGCRRWSTRGQTSHLPKPTRWNEYRDTYFPSIASYHLAPTESESSRG